MGNLNHAFILSARTKNVAGWSSVFLSSALLLPFTFRYPLQPDWGTLLCFFPLWTWTIFGVLLALLSL